MKQLNLIFIAFFLLLTGSASAQNFDEELDFFMEQLQEVAGPKVDFLEEEESFKKLVQYAKDGFFVDSEYNSLKDKMRAFIKLYWERLYLGGRPFRSKTANSIRALRAALDFENPVQTQNSRVKRKQSEHDQKLDELLAFFKMTGDHFSPDQVYKRERALNDASEEGFFKKLTQLIKDGALKGRPHASTRQKIRDLIKLFFTHMSDSWLAQEDIGYLEMALELTPDLDIDIDPIVYTNTNTNTNTNSINTNQGQ